MANGVWGFALTILRQVKIPLVPACGGEFCSCIQCGIFVRCYYKELFPQAQNAPFCPGGVWLGSFLYCPSKGIWTAIILQLPYMFAQLCLVSFCFVVEAGFMVRVSCLEGCGSQSNIGLFLVRCFHFRFIKDILYSAFFQVEDNLLSFCSCMFPVFLLWSLLMILLLCAFIIVSILSMQL